MSNHHHSPSSLTIILTRNQPDFFSDFSDDLNPPSGPMPWMPSGCPADAQRPGPGDLQHRLGLRALRPNGTWRSWEDDGKLLGKMMDGHTGDMLIYIWEYSGNMGYVDMLIYMIMDIYTYHGNYHGDIMLIYIYIMI